MSNWNNQDLSAISSATDNSEPSFGTRAPGHAHDGPAAESSTQPARNALERYVHFVAISGAALRLEEDDQAYVPLASTPCNMPAVTSGLVF